MKQFTVEKGRRNCDDACSFQSPIPCLSALTDTTDNPVMFWEVCDSRTFSTGRVCPAKKKKNILSDHLLSGMGFARSMSMLYWLLTCHHSLPACFHFRPLALARRRAYQESPCRRRCCSYGCPYSLTKRNKVPTLCRRGTLLWHLSILATYDWTAQ